MDEELEQLLPVFVAEARERLERLAGLAVALELDEAAAPELRRELHTLKGAAFGVGATKVGEIARRGEEHMRRSGGIGAALRDELENAARETIQFIEETTAHR